MSELNAISKDLDDIALRLREQLKGERVQKPAAQPLSPPKELITAMSMNDVFHGELQHGKLIEYKNQVATVRFKPINKGSVRVGAFRKLPPKDIYTLEFEAMFESGFDFRKGGKFGFGLAGGSQPTGGDIVDDGWTLRPMWRPDGFISLYSYEYGRDVKRHKWGKDYKTNFQAKHDEWFKTKYQIVVNSNGFGSLVGWMDDTECVRVDGIHWQKNHGAIISRLRFECFHGGGDPSWKPQELSKMQFRNLVVT